MSRDLTSLHETKPGKFVSPQTMVMEFVAGPRKQTKIASLVYNRYEHESDLLQQQGHEFSGQKDSDEESDIYTIETTESTQEMLRLGKWGTRFRVMSQRKRRMRDRNVPLNDIEAVDAVNLADFSADEIAEKISEIEMGFHVDEPSMSSAGRKFDKMIDPKLIEATQSDKQKESSMLLKFQSDTQEKYIEFSSQHSSLSRWSATIPNPETQVAYHGLLQCVILRESFLIKLMAVVKNLDAQYWRYAVLRFKANELGKPISSERLVSKREYIKKMQGELAVALSHIRSASVHVLDALAKWRTACANAVITQDTVSVIWQGQNYLQKMEDDASRLYDYATMRFWLGFEPNALMVPPAEHNPREVWAKSHEVHLISWKKRQRAAGWEEARKKRKGTMKTSRRPTLNPFNQHTFNSSANGTGANTPLVPYTEAALGIDNSRRSSISNLSLGTARVTPGSTAAGTGRSEISTAGNRPALLPLVPQPLPVIVPAIVPAIVTVPFTDSTEVSLVGGAFPHNVPAESSITDVSLFTQYVETQPTAATTATDTQATAGVRIGTPPDEAKRKKAVAIDTAAIIEKNGGNGSARAAVLSARAQSPLMKNALSKRGEQLLFQDNRSPVNAVNTAEVTAAIAEAKEGGAPTITIQPPTNEDVRDDGQSLPSAIVGGNVEPSNEKNVTPEEEEASKNMTAEKSDSKLVSLPPVTFAGANGIRTPAAPQDESRRDSIESVKGAEAAAMQHSQIQTIEASIASAVAAVRFSRESSVVMNSGRGGGSVLDSKSITSVPGQRNGSVTSVQGRGSVASLFSRPSLQRSLSLRSEKGSTEWVTMRDFCLGSWDNTERRQGLDSAPGFWSNLQIDPVVVEAAAGFVEVFPEVYLVPPLLPKLRDRCETLAHVIREERQLYDHMNALAEDSLALRHELSVELSSCTLDDLVSEKNLVRSMEVSQKLRHRQETDRGLVDGSITNYLRQIGSTDNVSVRVENDGVFVMTTIGEEGTQSGEKKTAFFPMKSLKVNLSRMRQNIEKSVEDSRSLVLKNEDHVAKVNQNNGMRNRRKLMNIKSPIYCYECATRIQSLARGFITRRRLQREAQRKRMDAAIRIVQSLTRGFLGRRAAQAKRALFHLEMMKLRKSIVGRKRAALIITKFIRIVADTLRKKREVTRNFHEEFRARKRREQLEKERTQPPQSLEPIVATQDGEAIDESANEMTIRKRYAQRLTDDSGAGVLIYFLPTGTDEDVDPIARMQRRENSAKLFEEKLATIGVDHSLTTTKASLLDSIRAGMGSAAARPSLTEILGKHPDTLRRSRLVPIRKPKAPARHSVFEADDDSSMASQQQDEEFRRFAAPKRERMFVREVAARPPKPLLRSGDIYQNPKIGSTRSTLPPETLPVAGPRSSRSPSTFSQVSDLHELRGREREKTPKKRKDDEVKLTLRKALLSSASAPLL